MTSPDRLAALATLVAAGAKTGETAGPAPVLERTGETVYAGGDVERLLIADNVALAYVSGAVLRYAKAASGDVITVNAKQARRLDELGLTVDVDANLDDVEDDLEDGKATDAQLERMTAPDLVAYVTQHPDERERVRLLEEARKTPRKTVLTATEPTPDADLDADLEADARAAAELALEDDDEDDEQ